MFTNRGFPRKNDVTILEDLTSVTGRAAWILAGGASRRMGRDKALLDVDGQPLALRVASAAAQVCGSVTLVGDPARYSRLGLPVVEDAFPGEGPLAGIETALRATESDWNLVLACDMPALDVGLLEQLFEAGGDCAVPRYEDGRVEPLCAVFHRRCHKAVRAALMAGIRKVTDAIHTGRSATGELDIRYVRVPESAPLANLNTPEDLRAWYAERKHPERKYKDG